MSKEYPVQVKKVVRKTKAGLLTLGIDSFMVLPKSEDSPLEMHSGFSRFKATILHKDDNNNIDSVYANIPAEEIFIMDKITNAVAELFIKRKIEPIVLNSNNNTTDQSSQNATSPGYTVKIQNGILKGKTPVQALLENADNKAKLIQQKKWLSDNLEKYPKNQTQIDAIDDALRLLDSNQLNKENINTEIIQSNNCFDIYKVDIRIPNAQKVDNKGNTFMYSINITCDMEKKNPIGINITNMSAPPNIDATGMVTANLQNVSWKKTLSINLTFDEWVKLICRLKNTVNNFETVNFAKQTRKASVKMATQMLKDGLDPKKVAEYTYLSEQEVKQIKY